jgi:SAM-dependent methyltransferase
MQLRSDTHLTFIRNAEFDCIRAFFPADKIVLELGGANGFQAALLSRVVKKVVSIDVNPHDEQVFPVIAYDGRTLPFEDAHFDMVFSSNVLEHIVDLASLLAEIGRVTKSDGLSVHILPSSTWRIWTSLSHYPAIPKLALGKLRGPRNSVHGNTDRDTKNEPAAKWARWIRAALISPRHGERGNALSEMFYFRRAWWRRTFAEHGWTVVSEFPSGILYSGNALCSTRLSLRARQRLAGVLGSSSNVFVLKRSGHDQAGE